MTSVRGLPGATVVPPEQTRRTAARRMVVARATPVFHLRPA
jgi:hypothetical protein